MKQRVLSGAVIVLVSGILLFASGSILFNAIISLLGLFALWELFAAAKYTADRALLSVCGLFAAVIPFFPSIGSALIRFSIVFAYVLALLILLLLRWERDGIEKIAFAFMVSALIPMGYTILISLRDLYLTHPGLGLVRSDGTLFLVLTLVGSWGTDVGGLFAGLLFGKHKLAPKISPKKTVEGAIGGILFSILGFYLALHIYVRFYAPEAEARYLALTAAAVLCACAGMLGDLAASAAKRSFHVKDFGHLIPGHGGILDRFDSVLLVAPVLFIFVQLFPLLAR